MSNLGTTDPEADAQIFLGRLSVLVDDFTFADYYLTHHQAIQVKQRLESALEIMKEAMS